MSLWSLRFKTKEINALADQYRYQDDLPVISIGERACQVGELGYEDFLTVCKWKSPRSQSRCRRNTPQEVAEITRIAFSTPVERLRIASLRCLHGVDWPTGSVLLHLAHRDPYPILDFRALWSLGFEKVPTYNFEFWWRYVQICRSIAEQTGVTMRTLDRALWQYSKMHQTSAK